MENLTKDNARLRYTDDSFVRMPIVENPTNLQSGFAGVKSL